MARYGVEIETLGGAWREFRVKRSPQLMAAASAGVLFARLALGAPGWRDAAGAAFMLGVYPFGEWAIHVHLLHRPPFSWRGHTVELATARAHRQHHEQPHRLDLINLSPPETLAVLLLAVPITVGAAAGSASVLWAPVPLGPIVTMLLCGYLLVAVYEWIHFLIHTACHPRTRYYRSIRRNHRLHHFKNEHYWHGVITTVGDRVLGTAPEHGAVSRSRTARSLHAGPPRRPAP